MPLNQTHTPVDISPVENSGGPAYPKAGRSSSFGILRFFMILLFSSFLTGMSFQSDSLKGYSTDFQNKQNYQQLLAMTSHQLQTQMNADPNALASMLNAIEPSDK